MVVKFVNVLGIKLLYKHHTKENLHFYTCSVTVAEFQKRLHLLNKLLAIFMFAPCINSIKALFIIPADAQQAGMPP